MTQPMLEALVDAIDKVALAHGDPCGTRTG
jgi:hypothetical protein